MLISTPGVVAQQVCLPAESLSIPCWGPGSRVLPSEPKAPNLARRHQAQECRARDVHPTREVTHEHQHRH